VETKSPTLSADQRLALVLRAVQRIEKAQGDLEDAVEALDTRLESVAGTVEGLTRAVDGLRRTLEAMAPAAPTQEARP
jgi:hypothetical protein